MRPYLLATPAALLLLATLGAPLVLLVRLSLCEQRGGFYTPGTWTLANFAALADAHGLWLLGFTVLFGAAVATCVLLVSFPLALWLRSLHESSRRVALSLILLPKFASALAVLFGLSQLLSAAGPLNLLLTKCGIAAEPLMLTRNLFGAVVAEVSLILPYAVLFLHVQLSSIDPALEDAARGLGASPWQTFRRVTLPLAMPGVIVAGQLALLWGLGAFLGPLLLGGPAETTLSVEVSRQAFDYGRWPRAAAAAVLLAVAAGLARASFWRRPR